MDDNKQLRESNEYVDVIELTVEQDKFEFSQSISTAMSYAELELMEIESKIQETEETLRKLTAECDKTDYLLAASSGAICGIMDVFLVGKPGDSYFEKVGDKWAEDKVKVFAKLCGWKDKGEGSASSAIRFLEKKFDIPYDQRGAGDAGSEIFELNPANHHFKSLGHNPTIAGLFFSILDQFTNQSHFVTKGQMISLQKADDGFELRGNNIRGKLFCGFVNWFGHLISDVSGSAGSKGRGMGIPSPFWSWTNVIIAIKTKLKLEAEFGNSINEIALNMYLEGYDARFQETQNIPIALNEMIVRFMYSVRRAIKYFISTDHQEYYPKRLWEACKPLSDVTVKRMLTVAHGTFCLIDIGEAAFNGIKNGNALAFFMHLNIKGVGRFSISLYGEGHRALRRYKVRKQADNYAQKQLLIEDYLEGLKQLSETYNDSLLAAFVGDLKGSDAYMDIFEQSALVNMQYNVPDEKTLKTKADIDEYFLGGGKNGKNSTF